MGLQIVLAKNKNIFRDGDPEFEYNKRYSHFGIYDPVGLIPSRPDKLLARWLKMVKYCNVNGFTPVAIFAVDNPSLSRMCRRLGMLTIGTSRDSKPQDYNKVVMDESLLLEVEVIYYFEIEGTDLERPSIIQQAEGKDIDILVIHAADASSAKTKTNQTVDPSRILKDQKAPPNRAVSDPYAEFPIEELMRQFITRTDDQSLPLEMPEGLHDFTKL